MDFSDNTHPASIGSYSIVRPLAHGRLTCLYEAKDPKSCDRPVVLKVLRNESPETVVWFRAIASVASGLDHPHILPFSQVSTEERFFVVMPFVEGKDLRQIVMDDGAFDSTRLLPILAATAEAVDYAHGRGIVHGDLHPKHILMDADAHVWLIGFREYGPEWPTDQPFGNLHHLAPEQLEGDSAARATDIYALAEVSYLCLCASFPFSHEDARSMLERKRRGPVPSLRERRPDFSRRLDNILQRAMAIRPDERYSSASEFVQSLSVEINRGSKS